ncbi:MAG: autotransporter strand-loop-strand O-heptosyltransferase [Acetobacteraceae bacterium]
MGGNPLPSASPAEAPPAPAPASSAAASAPAADPAKKPPYPSPAEMPTQLGPEGIRFDFNHGARVLLPNRETGSWRVRLTDLDTGNVLFEHENKGAFVASAKRYYVRFGVEIWALGEDKTASEVLNHAYEARGRDIIIQFPIGTLGDTMGWFPYAARFADDHGAQVTCAMAAPIIPLLRDAYPHIRFVTHEEMVEQKLADQAYATYSLGLFFDDKDCIFQPTDFRHVGLHRTAGYILGVDPHEAPAKLALPDDSRPIEDPYVCIAVQSSTQCKYWNNPRGWREVVLFLKQHGFRVVCIDQKPLHGGGLVWNHLPHGVDDQTGDQPLTERARWLKHAAFFVGLSSGLSWLAWAAEIPVVLISGFTHPTNEFDTPYRVINWHACNSCWNDPKLRFDHHDFLWCPRHANTPRQFECTRLITPEQVIAAIRRVPAFAERTQPRLVPAGAS